MKLKRALFFLALPLILLFTLVAVWGRLATPATLREDSQGVFDMLWGWLDMGWAWLSGPPVEATVVALIIVTATYVVWLFRDERLIRFSRMIFRKDRREAEYKLIADDIAVRALQAAMLAKHVLDTVNWDPIPKLKISPYTDEKRALASMDGDYWYDFFDHLGLPEGQIEGVLMRVQDNSDLLMKRYRQRIGDAGLRAHDNKAEWPKYEGDGIFPNESIRSRWHVRRAQIDEANRIQKEIKGKLEEIRMRWPRTINEETYSRLLKDIGEETLP